MTAFLTTPSIQETLTVLVDLSNCPQCQRDRAMDGVPTRAGLEEARKLVNQAQRWLQEYEEEIRALELRTLVNELKAKRQELIDLSQVSPEDRKTCLETAERYCKAIAVLTQSQRSMSTQDGICIDR